MKKYEFLFGKTFAYVIAKDILSAKRIAQRNYKGAVFFRIAKIY